MTSAKGGPRGGAPNANAVPGVWEARIPVGPDPVTGRTPPPVGHRALHQRRHHPGPDPVEGRARRPGRSPVVAAGAADHCRGASSGPVGSGTVWKPSTVVGRLPVHGQGTSWAMRSRVCGSVSRRPGDPGRRQPLTFAAICQGPSEFGHLMSGAGPLPSGTDLRPPARRTCHGRCLPPARRGPRVPLRDSQPR